MPTLLRITVTIVAVLALVCISYSTGETTQCSTCPQCQEQCPSNCDFYCSQLNGILSSSCKCSNSGGGGGGGGGSGGGGSSDTNTGWLIGLSVLSVLIPCACLLACCCLCYALVTSALGISLLIAAMVLLNWFMSLVSITGSISAVFKTLFSNWSSLSTVQLVELCGPLCIAVLSYLDIVWITDVCLLACLLLFGAEAWFFVELFRHTSVVPFVAAVSTILGVLIIILTLALAWVLYNKIRFLHMQLGFDIQTCRRISPQTMMVEPIQEQQVLLNV
jgi:hypothetical protein